MDDSLKFKWPPPVARSPITVPGALVVIDGWERSKVTSNADITVTDESYLTKVVIRASKGHPVAEILPVQGSTNRDGGTLKVGSGPAEWYLIGHGKAESMVVDLPIDGGIGFASWVDITHGRALLRITGRRADQLLSKLCSVDLATATTPDGSAFRTSLGAVTTDVIRDDQAGIRSYRLHCERSSGAYLLEVLLDAGQEFGCAAQ
ncbi:hypothetical protein LBMAG15_20280 [Actinomycetes bacterium]|nr:hypothetical protein LBMAG15_20280 [Actinomycetes bacterium]